MHTTNMVAVTHIAFHAPSSHSSPAHNGRTCKRLKGDDESSLIHAKKIKKVPVASVEASARLRSNAIAELMPVDLSCLLSSIELGQPNRLESFINRVSLADEYCSYPLQPQITHNLNEALHYIKKDAGDSDTLSSQSDGDRWVVSPINLPEDNETYEESLASLFEGARNNFSMLNRTIGDDR